MNPLDEVKRKLFESAEEFTSDRERMLVLFKFALIGKKEDGPGFILINLGELNPRSKDWSRHTNDSINAEWALLKDPRTKHLRKAIPEIDRALKRADQLNLIFTGQVGTELINQVTEKVCYLVYQYEWSVVGEELETNPKSKNFGFVKPGRITQKQIDEAMRYPFLLIDTSLPAFTGPNLKRWLAAVKNRQHKGQAPAVVVNSNPYFITPEMKQVMDSFGGIVLDLDKHSTNTKQAEK